MSLPSPPADAARLCRLEARIEGCRQCRDRSTDAPLPHEPRPIVRLSRVARIAIASQAPGARAHASGVPFDDASGERLRDWLGLDGSRFYDRDLVAIVPMGFCFPGYDNNGGDRPPRTECRSAWHDDIFAAMPQLDVILCIGAHAARYHLARLGLAPDKPVRMYDLVAQWRAFSAARHPRLFILPHPSWRNTAWLQRNAWFAAEVLPELRAAVAAIVKSGASMKHSA